MTYVPSGNPATGAEGLSALMRAEFLAIATAFTMLPRITTTGNFDTIFAQQGNFTIALPASAGTLALTAEVTTEVAIETARATAAEALLAPKASPALTGTPTAPTAAPGTNTTQIATTEFITAATTTLAPKASPALTGTPTAPTAAPGTNTTQLATTAFSAAAVAVETAARTAADALLAPLANPILTGTTTIATLSATAASASTATFGPGATAITGGLTQALGGPSGTFTTFQLGGPTIGSISGSGSTTAYNTTSDERLKNDLGLIEDSGAVIDKLKPRWFEWKASPGLGPQPGFFAQEVYAVYPWAVIPGDNGKPWMMDPAKLMAAAIAEIKALRARVAALEGAA
jgi:hypothetical protein